MAKICCRRAKAKIQDNKQNGRSVSVEPPPDSPPQLSTGFEADLHNMIHEDERESIKSLVSLSTKASASPHQL